MRGIESTRTDKYHRSEGLRMSAISDLVESIVDMPGEFADVAMQGPIEAVLLAFGALFVVVPSVVFTYLALGAGIDIIKPGHAETRHP